MTEKRAVFRLPGSPPTLSHKEPRVDPREDLYHDWKAAPSTTKLLTLLDAYSPEVERRARSLRAGHAPQGALKRFGRIKAIRAIKSWDPERSTRKGLGEWIKLNVTNITGDLARYQGDEVRLRGKRSEIVGQVLDAQASLADVFGRPPTLDELSAELGDSPRTTAAKIQQTLDELHGGNSGFTTEPDPFGTSQLTPAQVQIMRGIRLDLTPDEQLVWDYLLGINGKPRITKLSDIATKIGRANSFVSRARKKITKLTRDAGGEAF